MSGLTPLLDTLLATRLAQRVDLVPLKSEVTIASPGVVPKVEGVVNDVRHPSRALMLQKSGAELLTSRNGNPLLASAQLDKSVTLSIAARVVSAILATSPGVTTRVVGTEPLWPTDGLRVVSLLSATLAHAVANSGLFYESHLAQYAAGTRTLAELAREPQAGLDSGIKAPLILPPVDFQRESPALNSGAAVGIARLEGAPGIEGTSPPPTAEGNYVSFDQGKPGETGATASLQDADPDGLTGGAGSAELTRGRDAINFQSNVYRSIQKPVEQDPAWKNHAADGADAARTGTSGLAGIHPDAVALVRQQLELLALPIFRWEGEAWPGTPMDWEIHEEQEEPEKRNPPAENVAAPRTWRTRVLLGLPILKDIEVRISMVGTSLQVHLAAADNATRNLFGEDRTELLKHMEKHGLQVTGMQIGSLAAHADRQKMLKDDDVRS